VAGTLRGHGAQIAGASRGDRRDAEDGIDISDRRPKALQDALGPEVALVIGLCAEEACPVVPGARSVHWPLPDPPQGDLEAHRRIREELRGRIAGLQAELERGG